MANRTISENINQAISDFKGIKQALINKGVEIPQGTPTSEYGAKIEGMAVGGLDTSRITNFYQFCQNNRIPADDLDGLDTSNGTNFSYMFSRCTNLTTVPHLDTSNGTNFSYMFDNCRYLTTVPQLDTSKGTNFGGMFSYCDYRLTTIPQLDTSNGTNFYRMFDNCRYLTTLPQLDTSKGTNFSYMFMNCERLTTIPQLDTSNGTNFEAMFRYCYSLTTVGLTSFIADSSIFDRCSSLTNLTVTGTITVNATNALKLNSSTRLTVESLLNVLNALKDNTGGTTYNIQLGATNLSKLTDEQKAIATNKNYTLS